MISHLVHAGTRVRLRVVVARVRDAQKAPKEECSLGRKGTIKHLESKAAVLVWDGSKDLERVSLDDLVLC